MVPCGARISTRVLFLIQLDHWELAARVFRADQASSLLQLRRICIVLSPTDITAVLLSFLRLWTLCVECQEHCNQHRARLFRSVKERNVLHKKVPHLVRDRSGHDGTQALVFGTEILVQGHSDIQVLPEIRFPLSIALLKGRGSLVLEIAHAPVIGELRYSGIEEQRRRSSRIVAFFIAVSCVIDEPNGCFDDQGILLLDHEWALLVSLLHCQSQ